MKWLSYKLEETEAEARYRAGRMEEAYRQVKVAAYVTLVLLLVFAPFDWALLLPEIEHLVIVMAFRVLALLGIGAVLFRLRRFTHWSGLSRQVSISAALILMHLLVLHACVNEPSGSHIAIAVLAILVIYTLLPLELETEIFLSGCFTLGTALIWGMHHWAQDALYNSFAPPALMTAANVFGVIFSLQIRRSRRLEFVAREQAHRANALKDATIETKNQLFAIVSHDLRNTIGTTVSIGELLTDPSVRLDPDSHRVLLDDLAQNARDTYMLLDNLLQWARSETGDLKLRPELTSVEALMEAVFPAAKWAAEAKNIRLEWEAPAGAGIYGDPTMIQCVLRNLLSNAVKFTPNRGRVRLTAKPIHQDRIVIEVVDTGVGIPADRLAHLFDREYVETTPGTLNEKGTGLGLQVCQRFLRLHGEALTVSSHHREGTTFSFELPQTPDTFRGKRSG
jgi:signal transduction histidine kinase